MVETGEGDGVCLGAAVGSCSRTYTADNGLTVLIGRHLRCGDRELGDVHCEVGAGIVAVEDVEELSKGADVPAVADSEGTGDAQVGLHVRTAAKFVETGVRRWSVVELNKNASGVVLIGDGDGTRALQLVDGA